MLLFPSPHIHGRACAPARPPHGVQASHHVVIARSVRRRGDSLHRVPPHAPPPRPVTTHAGLRFTDDHDPTLHLPDTVRADLDARLADPGFCAQVSLMAAEAAPVEYTGRAFTPVPWGPSTPRGVPAEWEACLDDGEHVVVNVPPVSRRRRVVWVGDRFVLSLSQAHPPLFHPHTHRRCPSKQAWARTASQVCACAPSTARRGRPGRRCDKRGERARRRRVFEVTDFAA